VDVDSRSLEMAACSRALNAAQAAEMRHPRLRGANNRWPTAVPCYAAQVYNAVTAFQKPDIFNAAYGHAFVR
jgi:hypothetical protein